MNTFFALLVTTLFAHADAGPAIRLDLDGDGKTDLVQILPLNDQNDRLSVTLSKNGARLNFDHLLKHFPAKQETCDQMGHQELKDLGGGAFEWKQVQGNMDGCMSEHWTVLHLRLVGQDLQVESSLEHRNSWSMGDDSPDDDTLIDFQNHVIKIDMSEAHSADAPTHVVEAMSTDCAANLRAVDRDGGTLPMCAAQPAMFLFRENYPEDKPTITVCPDFHGDYSCVYKEFNETKRVVVVQRQENGANVYDDDMEPAELVTDGTPRELPTKKNEDLTKSTLTATCRRETLHLHVDTVFGQVDGGKVINYTPFSSADTLWTQLDLAGDHFNVTTTTYYDGQAKPEVQTLDCRRAK